jgi:hypothetical protein
MITRRKFISGSAAVAAGSALAGPVGFRLPGAAWTPRSIASLQLWLDASQITGLNDGDAVTTWADLSGNGNDATQATGSKKPTYQTNELNGRPVVRFDGVDDWVESPLSFSSDFLTVFAVVKRGAGNVPLSLNGGSGDDYNSAAYAELLRDGSGGFGAYRNNLNLAGATYASGYKVIVQTFDGAVMSHWLNGTQGTNRVSTGTFSPSFATVGAALVASVKAAFLSGDVAELGVAASTISSGRSLALQAYLNEKWAIY